jgi:DNA-binding MarR family transcriptional regulator
MAYNQQIADHPRLNEVEVMLMSAAATTNPSLQRACKLLTAALDADINGIQQLLTLLVIAQHEGEPIGAYQKRLGVSSSVVSAHILELGPKKRSGAPGLGLVQVSLNPAYMREHLVTLTLQGRELVKRVEKLAA